MKLNSNIFQCELFKIFFYYFIFVPVRFVTIIGEAAGKLTAIAMERRSRENYVSFPGRLALDWREFLTVHLLRSVTRDTQLY